MPNPYEKAAKWEVLCISAIGYVVASTFKTYWQVKSGHVVDRFFAPESIVLMRAVSGIFAGPFFLFFPTLSSFQLNPEIEGFSRSIAIRSLIYGMSGGLFLGGISSENGEFSFLWFVFLYAVVFCLAIFIFARRPDGTWVIPPRK